MFPLFCTCISILHIILLLICTFISNIPAFISYKSGTNSGFFTVTFSIGISKIASNKDFNKSLFSSLANTLLNTISDVKGSFFVSFSIIIPPLLYKIFLNFAIPNSIFLL